MAENMQATKFNTVTRMLLSSDGSTTLLLESILQTPLYVEVLQQVESSYDVIPAEVAQYLHPTSSDLVIYRESCLKTSDNFMVSFNSVWICLKDSENFEHELLDQDKPLGRQLNRVHHKRSLLGYGEREHIFDHTKYMCPYKHYLIYFADRRNALYIHETFLPSILE
jgi:chorismate-pyruvate lyase